MCLNEIAREGLPEPPKSSCFFCPSKKPAELISLVIEQPQIARRIVEMEMRAGPNLKAIDGLWGTGTKGTDGGVAKPGSMSEFMLVWMIDGRAYERFPKTDDRGLLGREARRLPHVGRVYLPVVSGGDADDYGPTDPAAVAALAAQGRAAALALRAAVERDHGAGSVDRMIAAGHVRAARRARIARARDLAKRIAEKHQKFATMGPRPELVEGDEAAAKRSGKRKDAEARARVVARNAWDRFFQGLRNDETEFAPLFAEFGHDLIYRPAKDEDEAMEG